VRITRRVIKLVESTAYLERLEPESGCFAAEAVFERRSSATSAVRMAWLAIFVNGV